MARMTNEEADRLDEKWTKNLPKPGLNGTGFFTRCKAATRTVTIDDLSADYLMTKAMTTHKIPAEIIGEMVQERIAVSL
jgi:hypothetical protein